MGSGATAQAAEAAALAVEAIRAAYREHGPGDDCAIERAFLPLAVRGAGTLIATTLEDGLTTASVVKVCDRGDGAATALICNVGDSRVYRYTRAGELRQCTLDDSMFGGDWDLQRQLGEVVVPTGLLEQRLPRMASRDGPRPRGAAHQPTSLGGSGRGWRRAARRDRRGHRQPHVLRATPAAPRRTRRARPHRSGARRCRRGPQPRDQPPPSQDR